MALGIRYRTRAGACALLLCAAMLAVTHARSQAPIPAPSAPGPGKWHDVSLDDYRKHLASLLPIVQACGNARDIAHCDPLLVGPDDRVPIGSGVNAQRRLIRYGWLRVLFSKAVEPDNYVAPPAQSARPSLPQPRRQPPPPSDAQSPEPTTTQLLQAAETRLAYDLAQAAALASPPPLYTAQRATMRQVLAGPDFRNLEQPTVSDALLEKLGAWLNRLFASAAKLQSRSPWIGRLIVLGFILLVCVALGWGLLQLERRWRTRLAPEHIAPAPGAPSSRDWQHWLDDARRAAAQGQWREAIHFLYWAAIARLEAKRLWPADRARTPREYLALVAANDPRKPGLAQLTRSFERIWYGGQPASEPDYQCAESLVEQLIASSAGRAQGGAS